MKIVDGETRQMTIGVLTINYFSQHKRIQGFVDTPANTPTETSENRSDKN